MKTVLVTVAWSRSVLVSVDETKLGSSAYVESLQDEAVLAASIELDAKDGFVTDCQDCPALVE